MKKIVFIVGSLRKNSFNRSLAKLAEAALQDKAKVEYIQADAVPFLNQDIEFRPCRYMEEKYKSSD